MSRNDELCVQYDLDDVTSRKGRVSRNYDADQFVGNKLGHVP